MRKPFISMKENKTESTENTIAKDNESLHASLNRAASNKSFVKDVFGLKNLTRTKIVIVLSQQNTGCFRLG